MTLDESDWDAWLDHIEAHGVNLTTWELEFIERLQAIRSSAGRLALTTRQAEVLERIYSERTP